MIATYTKTLPSRTQHLSLEKQATTNFEGISCLALAHNEARLLPQFLQHYRSIGVEHFIIVDDHSTDETGRILSDQNDVSVYKPVAGSSYDKNKRAWRCGLLDSIADNRWVLLPDIDEHLYYPQMDELDISRLAENLEIEGARALYTVMVEMYADKPLKEHRFVGGSLVEAFPFFDKPSDPISDYRLLPPAKRFLKRFPTPPVCAYGGARERLFFGNNKHYSFPVAWILRKFAHLGRPLSPTKFDMIANLIARQLTKKRFGHYPLSMTKIALIKWQKGMELSGGAHGVSERLKLSETTGALLHFVFAHGVEKIRYSAERGKHAAGSIVYVSIMSQPEKFEHSPYHSRSMRFNGVESLVDCGLVRDGS